MLSDGILSSCFPPFKVNVRMVLVLGTISQVMVASMVFHSGTQQREEVGLVVAVVDVRFSCMSSVFAFDKKSNSLFVEGKNWIHFFLSRIGSCAAGTGSHFIQLLGS